MNALFPPRPDRRADDLDDGELLRRFAAGRAGDAFALLLERHGPMVLGLARRVAGDAQAAEDVLQATFLTLARRAGSLRRPESLACWLHHVAFRLAVRARHASRRRQERETRAFVPRPRTPLEELTAAEMLTVLDEELQALPERHRAPLILCCLEGLSQEEAAQRLGCSPGSVRGRLERGRARLRLRLEKRGLVLPAALAATLLVADAVTALSPALVQSTVEVSLGGAHATPAVAALSQGVLPLMTLTPLRAAGVVLLLALVAGTGLAVRTPPAPTPDDPAPATAKEDNKDNSYNKKVDLHGDPLPDGAALRLGTLRRRAVGAKLAVSADGRSIIGVRAGKYVSVWDAATGKLRASRVLGGQPWDALALSADGRHLITNDHGPDGLTAWDVSAGKPLHRLKMDNVRHIGPAAFSPDGRLVAAVGQGQGTFAIRAWDIATGKEVFRSEVKNDVSSDQLAFTPDGKRLLASFTSTSEGTYCWNLATGALAWQNKEIGNSLVMTPGGTILSWERGTTRGVDSATGLPVAGPKLPELTWENHLTLTPDGRTLLVSGAEGVLVWDLGAGRELRTLKGAGEEVVVAPDGKTVVTNNGSLQRWDLATGRSLYPENFGDGHVGEVMSVAFSADGTRLASASADGSVRLWDAATGRAIHVWRGHEARRPIRLWRWMNAGVRAVDITPDGKRVLSAGSDEYLKLWDAVTSKETLTIPLTPRRNGEGERLIYQLRITPDGSRAVAAFNAEGWTFAGAGGAADAGDMRPRLTTWDLKTGRLLSLHPVEMGKRGSALSGDGRFLAAHGALTDTTSGREVAKLEGQGDYSDLPVAFSADGRLVVGGALRTEQKNGTTYQHADGLRVWEAATGKVVARLTTESWVGQVAFPPDNRFIVTNDLDGVRLWDLTTGKVVRTRPMPEQVRGSTNSGSYASCLAFTPDGRRLATGHPDGTILLWDFALPRKDSVAPADLAALWTELSGADAAKAWRAVWRLSESPKEAVPLLRGALKPVLPAAAEVTRPLIADLDSDTFAKRDAALKRLKELGPRAEAALRAVLKGNPSAEQRQRVEDVLALLAELGKPPSPEALRDQRAVSVLERAGTPEARQLLEEWAAGAESAPLTRAAKAALGRLSGTGR